MIVIIQAPSVVKLLWGMLEEMPLDKQEIYAPLVDEAASLLENPNLNGAVPHPFGYDGDIVFQPRGW